MTRLRNPVVAKPGVAVSTLRRWRAFGVVLVAVALGLLVAAAVPVVGTLTADLVLMGAGALLFAVGACVAHAAHTRIEAVRWVQQIGTIDRVVRLPDGTLRAEGRLAPGVAARVLDGAGIERPSGVSIEGEAEGPRGGSGWRV